MDQKAREVVKKVDLCHGCELFRIARQRAREKKDVVGVSFLIDESGAVKVSVDDQKKIWKEHMEKLMNVENKWSGSIDASKVEGAVRRIKVEEVLCAMNRMKIGKASGPSGVAIELFKASGDKCLKSLTNIFNILYKDKLPEEWMLISLVPIFKGKGDPLNPNSYKGIKLLKHGFKLYEKVLDGCLHEVVDIDKMQCGFIMPGRGTVDAVFVLRRLSEKFRAKNKELFLYLLTWKRLLKLFILL